VNSHARRSSLVCLLHFNEWCTSAGTFFNFYIAARTQFYCTGELKSCELREKSKICAICYQTFLYFFIFTCSNGGNNLLQPFHLQVLNSQLLNA